MLVCCLLSHLHNENAHNNARNANCNAKLHKDRTHWWASMLDENQDGMVNKQKKISLRGGLHEMMCSSG
jgi:hypothetical protein